MTKQTRCRYCGGPIEWYETTEGWRPLEPDTGERHLCAEFTKANRAERKETKALQERLENLAECIKALGDYVELIGKTFGITAS